MKAAWQLGEHPLVIGGGDQSYTYDVNNETFEKGDVHKI
jgi:hypothetical protein